MRNKIQTTEPEMLRDSLGRKRYLHKYQFGKPDEPITKADLQAALEHGRFTDALAHKSYLVITSAIGSRKTEALEIRKEDMHREGSSLYVKIPAKKHGARGGEIELPLSWLGMDLVLSQWMKTRAGKKVWRFSPATAWRIIKRVFPRKSPHHLRWSVITELRALKDARQITTDEIKSWTGIKRDSTIEGYGLKTQAGIHKISEVRSQKE
ncbi:MAG: hypothetical protein MUP17_09550 [candidate division Zixibacteria bacterium]|nr:hypothetical protein [candidate division Zixibacteria bacterium]